MKQKLLIALGCSHTEGVGTWSDEVPNKFLSLEEYEKFHDSDKINFLHQGWPKLLGQMMGFDKVLNLGIGGMSTDGNVKFWFENYHNQYFEDWDVTMIWLLPDSFRLTFYNDGILSNPQKNDKVWEEWVKYMRIIHLDSELEQMISFRIMNNECKLKNIKLIAFVQDIFFLDKLLYLDGTPIIKSNLFELLNKKEYKSTRCNHLNHQGYKILAQDMYDKIKTNFGNIEMNIPNDNIICEWGNQKKEWDRETIKDEYNQR